MPHKAQMLTKDENIVEVKLAVQYKVKDARALWLSGEPHILVYLDASGRPVTETERTVDASTLAWESVVTGITYRLETKLSKEEAVRFAESLQ